MKKPKFLLLLLSVFYAFLAQPAQGESKYLSPQVAALSTQQLLAAKPFTIPAYTDRTYWQSLPQEVTDAINKAAAKSKGYVWGSVPLTSYLEYKRTGNRKVNEKYYNARRDNLRNLVLGELVEGKGNYIDDIADGVWSLCEQSFWGISAHTNLQAAGIGVPDVTEPTIDLTAGEIASLLAFTYHLLGAELDKISPLISQRIVTEIDRRITTPYLQRNDFWWQGFIDRAVNNWNPWCNYNVLVATLLTQKNSEIKSEMIRKTAKSVDVFIAQYKPDGACEEGPAYWDHAAGKMVEYLELIKRITADKVNIFDDSRIQNMGTYIYNAYIGEGNFLNFADASARSRVLSDIVYRYGMDINNKQLMAFGALLAQNDSFFEGTLDQILHKLSFYKAMHTGEASYGYPAYFVSPDTQIAAARSEQGSNKGYYFGVKGGYNAESHNHNDVGTFILYYNNDPIIVDGGVGTYTGKTFSKERYEIWTMRSMYHNLPLINGVEQSFGAAYKASDMKVENTKTKMSCSLGIASAYPTDAASTRWDRDYVLDRKKGLTITDQFELTKSIAPNQWVLLLANGVEPIAKGKLRLKGKKEQLILTYDETLWNYKVEPIPIDDKRLSDIWGETLYRLVLTANETPLKGKYSFKISK